MGTLEMSDQVAAVLTNCQRAIDAAHHWARGASWAEESELESVEVLREKSQQFTQRAHEMQLSFHRCLLTLVSYAASGRVELYRDGDVSLGWIDRTTGIIGGMIGHRDHSTPIINWRLHT